MAARYFGLDRGSLAAVSEGSSTTSKGLEVVIADISVAWTKEEVVRQLEKIQRHILDNRTYPVK
jgi:hypothetical protein